MHENPRSLVVKDNRIVSNPECLHIHQLQIFFPRHMINESPTMVYETSRRRYFIPRRVQSWDASTIESVAFSTGSGNRLLMQDILRQQRSQEMVESVYGNNGLLDDDVMIENTDREDPPDDGCKDERVATKAVGQIDSTGASPIDFLRAIRNGEFLNEINRALRKDSPRKTENDGILDNSDETLEDGRQEQEDGKENSNHGSKETREPSDHHHGFFSEFARGPSSSIAFIKALQTGGIWSNNSPAQNLLNADGGVDRNQEMMTVPSEEMRIDPIPMEAHSSEEELDQDDEEEERMMMPFSPLQERVSPRNTTVVREFEVRRGRLLRPRRCVGHEITRSKTTTILVVYPMTPSTENTNGVVEVNKKSTKESNSSPAPPPPTTTTKSKKNNNNNTPIVVAPPTTDLPTETTTTTPGGSRISSLARWSNALRKNRAYV